MDWNGTRRIGEVARTHASRTASRKSSGQGLVEFALALPLLILLLLITADAARAFSAYIEVSNMAREGAHFGSLSLTNAQDTAGIESAALGEAGLVAGADAVVSATLQSDSFSAPGGTAFQSIRVTVTYDFKPLFPLPPVIPETMTISRSAEMRVLET